MHVQALRGVSFRVDRGEIFGLLGPNGAGKTTLIKILLGIVKADRGEASLLGRAARRPRRAAARGYLPENLRIPRHHTGVHRPLVLRWIERAFSARSAAPAG